jgi:two-component system, NtrC family, nitrogen regulation response regulator NtrX
VVIISGHGNIEIAVAAIKQGAYDFIEKPFNIDQLMVVIGRAMETAAPAREHRAPPPRRGRAVMIGSSPSFRGCAPSSTRSRSSNGRVMLSGPPGCGKETAARYIHANSDRAEGPFVTVGSASVEPDRMEEVLFGRESAARGIEPGLLEQAHGGVIYFDEVADMPLGTQSKILRVLTEQQFQRAGGSDRVRVDIRVISSTNRDLEAEARAGSFRQELYHRLNVVPIRVPSLEERREDIPELARHFVETFNREQGLPLRALSDEAQALLQTMSWPGNVRQLRNVMERVLILGADRGHIGATELADHDAKREDDGRLVLSGAFATLPAARRPRALRARVPPHPDQPLRRQHQPHGDLRGDGALGTPPQAQVARRGDDEQVGRARRPCRHRGGLRGRGALPPSWPAANSPPGVLVPR